MSESSKQFRPFQDGLSSLKERENVLTNRSSNLHVQIFIVYSMYTITIMYSNYTDISHPIQNFRSCLAFSISQCGTCDNLDMYFDGLSNNSVFLSLTNSHTIHLDREQLQFSSRMFESPLQIIAKKSSCFGFRIFRSEW